MADITVSEFEADAIKAQDFLLQNVNQRVIEYQKQLESYQLHAADKKAKLDGLVKEIVARAGGDDTKNYTLSTDGTKLTEVA